MGKSNGVVVAGIGNILLKDEGIGIHVARSLKELELPVGTEIIDGGTTPNLLDYLNPVEKLIIIDAIEVGDSPGAIYRFHPDDLTLPEGKSISLHEIGLLEDLKILSLSGKEPQETVIIGIQVKEIGWGTDLSTELHAKIPDITRVVLGEIGISQQGNKNSS